MQCMEQAPAKGSVYYAIMCLLRIILLATPIVIAIILLGVYSDSDRERPGMPDQSLPGVTKPASH